jgi:hypothetical protein
MFAISPYTWSVISDTPTYSPPPRSKPLRNGVEWYTAKLLDYVKLPHGYNLAADETDSTEKVTVKL